MKEHQILNATTLSMWSCGMCEQSFSLKVHLQEHIKSHNKFKEDMLDEPLIAKNKDEKLFSCNKCGKFFLYNIDCNTHFKKCLVSVGNAATSNLLEQPLLCIRCWKYFSMESEFSSHVLVCQGEASGHHLSKDGLGNFLDLSTVVKVEIKEEVEDENESLDKSLHSVKEENDSDDNEDIFDCKETEVKDTQIKKEDKDF